MHRSIWRDNVRIVGAIAAKDIVDAIRNKATLSIILGVGVLVLSSMAFPMLVRLQGTPFAVIYDPGRSTLIRALTAREEFRLRIVESQDEMEAAVGGASELALGLVIPEGFKEAAGTGGRVEMAGYVPHWADPDEVAAQVAFFEGVLSEASWQTVSIDVAGRAAYPSADDMGYPHMVVTSLVIAVLTVGLAMVPYLLLEEKGTHTFDALMVSPARYDQIVMGKALAGLVYCLTAGAVVLAINAQWVVHWWLVAVAVGLGAGFAVMLGLLLGSLFDNVSSVTVWMALLLMLLQVPIFLVGLDTSTWSSWLRAAFLGLPSVALDKLAAAAMLGALDDVNLGGSVALLLGSTLMVAVLVVWRIRREGR